MILATSSQSSHRRACTTEVRTRLIALRCRRLPHPLQIDLSTPGMLSYLLTGAINETAKIDEPAQNHFTQKAEPYPITLN